MKTSLLSLAVAMTAATPAFAAEGDEQSADTIVVTAPRLTATDVATEADEELSTGPDGAANFRVTDRAPAGLADVVWSCDASGGAICPQSGGIGDLDVVVTSLRAGGLLNFTLYGNATGAPEIVNTAALALPSDNTLDDPTPGNNSATDSNRLENLFRNGFEPAAVNSASGAFHIPGLALRGAVGEVAVPVYSLDDAQGEALRVYARTLDSRMQLALASRDSQGRLRLGAWQGFEGEPTLNWTARRNGDGWLFQGAELR